MHPFVHAPALRAALWAVALGLCLPRPALPAKVALVASCPRALAGTVAKDRWLTKTDDGQSVLLERLPATGPWIPGLLDAPAVSARARFLKRGLLVDAETVGLVAPVAYEIALLPFLYDARDGTIAFVLPAYEGTEDPGFPLPDFNVRLTRLTDAAVRGTRFDRARLRAELEKADLVLSHNAEFDRPIFDRLDALSTEKPWACSMKDVDWYKKGFPSRGLEALALRHGFWDAGHRALADARQTLRLLATVDGATGKPYFAELREGALRNDREIALTVPYAYRPLLKDRGYEWDRRRRVWTRTVPLADAERREAEERKWYDQQAATTRDRGFQGFAARDVGAVDRYRSDVIDLPGADPLVATGIAPPEPLPSRARPLGGNRFALGRLAPLEKVDRDAVLRWKERHRSAVPAVLVRAVPTGRDRGKDALVELAAIPLLVDEATGEVTAAADPYHGFEAPPNALSGKAKERLGLDETVLAGHAFDREKLGKWFGASRYVFAYDAADERPWVDGLLGAASRNRIWVSLNSDVGWSARGDVKSFFEPIFARHGFFVDGPDALALATGLLETLRTDDAGVPPPAREALAEAHGVYLRVTVADAPFDASDALRAEGLKFHAPLKTWERVVPGEAIAEVVRRLRLKFPKATVSATTLQPAERYRERQ